MVYNRSQGAQHPVRPVAPFHDVKKIIDELQTYIVHYQVKCISADPHELIVHQVLYSPSDISVDLFVLLPVHRRSARPAQDAEIEDILGMLDN
jgi:hypothetical protein